jgi:hypothetical protein
VTRAIVIALVIAATAGVAHAHKPSDAHLRLAVDGDQLTGQISIAVRDLDGALAVDADGNGDITWAEITAAQMRIASYVQERVVVAGCPITLGAPGLLDLTDGAYWTAPISAVCESRVTELTLTYKILFDIDAQHRGIIHVAAPGQKQTLVVRDSRPISVAIADPTATARVAWLGAGAAASLLALLGLLVLVAPLALRRRFSLADAAEVAGSFVAAQLASFALATAEIVSLPDDWISLAVPAATLALAGATALGKGQSRALLALELGLLQGFALATALADHALPSHSLWTAMTYAVSTAAVQLAFAMATAGGLLFIATRRRSFLTALVLLVSVATLVVAAMAVVHHIAV